MLALADDTLVDDKDSLRQELADHLDPTLSYGENKTALQDYLASVTPMNTDVTAREVMDYEARINTVAPEEIEQANDPFLLESLRERAANGDSSASVQLELMEIKRDGFAQMGYDATAQNEFTPIFPMENQMQSPIMDTAQNAEPFISAPDIAMDWCSSTPETLAFSESFVPPTETFNPVESWGAPEQASVNPQMKNKTII